MDGARLDLLPRARRRHRRPGLRANGVGRRERRAVAVAPGVDENPSAAIALGEFLREVIRIPLNQQRAHGVGEPGHPAEFQFAVDRHDDVEALRAGRLDPAREVELREEIAQRHYRKAAELS